MQQADTAGSTRSGAASPGNPFRFSTVTVELKLDIGAPLMMQDVARATDARLAALDQRIDGLRDFIALAITSDDLDGPQKNVMSHIWQSLDDMRVLSSDLVRGNGS